MARESRGPSNWGSGVELTCIDAQNIQQKNISSFNFFPWPPTTKNLPVTKNSFLRPPDRAVAEVRSDLFKS